MAAKKMWGGRFKGATSASVEDYTQSVSFDSALWAQDIRGSKAHSAMLARQGILTEAERDRIHEGLDAIAREIQEGTFEWKTELEDVHMNIESRLSELVGDAGKKLHTGRSRNDQVATGFRLFVSDAIGDWQAALKRLVAALAEQADANRDTLLPGYTHLQPAQPVSLAQHLLAYAWMFKRDCERLADADVRVRTSPLGAAALAGTTHDLDPAYSAELLGMERVFDNSMDAVSDRDFVAESIFAGSLIMAHLSRLCEEIILWSNPNFAYIRLPDAFATGSSIMPQKKNPDVAEIMRGKTGRVYGSLMGLLTTIKGLPLTYNRDLQEDKEPFLDADKTVETSVSIMAEMVAALDFDAGSMRAALTSGFLNATELADYLAAKGMPFRDAHHATGAAVALAEDRGVQLEELELADLQKITDLVEADVFDVLTPEAAVARRKAHGGTGPNSVATQLAKLEDWLK